MAKLKSAYVCNDCGTEHGQWQGQCASCGEWNTLSKINLGPANAPSAAANFKRQGITGSLSSVTTLNDINLEDQPRIATGIGEFDRVLGEKAKSLVGGGSGGGSAEACRGGTRPGRCLFCNPEWPYGGRTFTALPGGPLRV